MPIDKIITYLKAFVSGEDCSRLYRTVMKDKLYFALQSLTLWREIIDDINRLWPVAEEDLLSESITYSWKDTGQGYQRAQ